MYDARSAAERARIASSTTPRPMCDSLHCVDTGLRHAYRLKSVSSIGDQFSNREALTRVCCA